MVAIPRADFSGLSNDALMTRLIEARFNVEHSIPGSAVLPMLRRKVEALEAECRLRCLTVPPGREKVVR